MTTATVPDSHPIVLEGADGAELTVEIVRQGDPAPVDPRADTPPNFSPALTAPGSH